MGRIVTLMAVLSLAVCSASPAAADGPPPKAEPASKPTTAPASELKTPAAELSYALGMDIGSFLKDLKTEIDLDAFLRAVKETLAGKELLLTPERAEEVKTAFSKKMREEQEREWQALAQKNLKEGEAFLAANKDKKGVVTTKSGLQYAVLQEGTGATPKPADTVSVHYRGTLLNGTEFDSSYKRGAVSSVPLERVIPGWAEAVLLMKVGGKLRAFIPAGLAYGEEAPREIGPNAVLIFEIELLGIVE